MIIIYYSSTIPPFESALQHNPTVLFKRVFVSHLILCQKGGRECYWCGWVHLASACGTTDTMRWCGLAKLASGIPVLFIVSSIFTCSPAATPQDAPNELTVNDDQMEEGP